MERNLKALSLEGKVLSPQSKKFQPDPGEVLCPNSPELMRAAHGDFVKWIVAASGISSEQNI